MTEHEYMIEMLCSLPKCLLEKRIFDLGQTRDNVPKWLINIEDDLIIEALSVYEKEYYIAKREEIRNAL